MNTKLDQLRSLLDTEIASYISQLPEDNLHTPIKYIMSLGGKRIRPSLVLLSANAFDGSFEKAMPAALAVEIFHNFTLVHDDIMDEAPLRRGEETVHQKWDINTAILSGDAMVIEAYKQLTLCGAEKLPELLDLFNRTSAEVCLGQQYDMDFEDEQAVTEKRYIEMIGLKTAVLLGCSLQMGAILSDATREESEAIYAFGKAAGIGFQLQDDYLDAFGNPENFGKQVGGDIISNKKTYLIIRALQKASAEQKQELEAIYFKDQISDSAEKVKRVRQVFLELEVDQDIQNRSEEYFAEAKRQLDRTNLSAEGREQMEGFLKILQGRRS
ncbi:MAG TPA: polyprenyl synthetase family protein [Cryomorphaceae bacterium]|nr:polyprenyl synthetase family protein [Cryomorphaceae bacterium]